MCGSGLLLDLAEALDYFLKQWRAVADHISSLFFLILFIYLFIYLHFLFKKITLALVGDGLEWA